MQLIPLGCACHLLKQDNDDFPSLQEVHFFNERNDSNSSKYTRRRSLEEQFVLELQQNFSKVYTDTSTILHKRKLFYLQLMRTNLNSLFHEGVNHVIRKGDNKEGET